MGGALRSTLAAVAFAAACAAAAQPAPAGDPARVEQGRQLYLGTHPALQAPGAAMLDGAPIPPAAAACVACHRPSGLGSAESNTLVPPVAGYLLFNALSPQTGRRLPWPTRDRTRPAYDAASLQRALNEGRAPDGVALHPPMPRYRLGLDDVRALASYLETLSVTTAAGVTDDEVVFATITTPDAPPAQVADLLATLRAFFADKNGGTRHEASRRAQAVRTDSTMYRRYRRWRLEHWALEGDPATWGAQLAARYRTTPVFAVLSGLSYDTWAPVHAFCEAERVPCLLPNAWLPPEREDFYSVYFSAGLPAEAKALAERLAGTREVVLWTGDDAAAHRQRAAIEHALAARGIAVARRAARADETIVSTLAGAPLAARLAAAATPRQLFLLPGALAGLADALLPADERVRDRTIVVTPLAPRAQAERQMARARAWLARRGLAPAHEQVALNALAAGFVAVETLMHVDDRFTREYCLEKIEHNLENIPPLTAYPRLAIGPTQRFASRQVTFQHVTRDDAIAVSTRAFMIGAPR